MGQSTPVTSDHLPISPSSTSTSKTTTMTNGASPSGQPPTEHHHIWLVTGPAGCGKSTVAQFIAKAMNLPFLEGDEVYQHFLHIPVSYKLTNKPQVPPPSQHRQNEQRNPPNRRRPLGLAHPSPRRIPRPTVSRFAGRRTHLLSTEAEIPRRDPSCAVLLTRRPGTFHLLACVGGGVDGSCAGEEWSLHGGQHGA